jgi:hypothetical protein
MRTPEAPVRRAVRIAIAPVALALCALALPLLAPSQTVAPAPQPQASAAPPAQARPALAHASAPASRAGKGVTVAKPVTHPVWRDLSPSQQQALAPLAAHWDTLNEAQKRKWIALSANFPRMSGEEQAKLHSRMTEWAALSPQQRSIARLNYGAAKKLSPDDKKAKWEAYQALPPEEKKKLAAKAAKPPATAAALRPVPAEKLAVVPKPQPRPASKAPRIAAAPNQVDNRTLLPQPQQQQPQLLQTQQPQPQPLPPQAGTPD